MKASAEAQDQRSQQFLTFLIDGKEYGLEIFKVREIRGYSPITPIPNLPPYLRGVINLRGTVLPVVDVRMKFQLPAFEYNKFTVIVIATVGSKTVGLLVDAVSDVLTVAKDSMRETPDFGVSVDTRFITGVFESHGQLTVALNLEELLSSAELQSAAA